MKISAVVVAVALTGPPLAQAQFADPGQLARVESVGVVAAVDFSGSAAGRCAPSGDTLQTEAELVLRSAGIPVESVDYRNPRQHKFVVSTIGVTAGALCAVALNFDLWRFQNVVDTTSNRAPTTSRGMVVGFQQSGLLTGNPVRMGAALREEVNAATATLANEILKAQGR